MKHILFLLTLCLTFHLSSAQNGSTLIFYSEKGETFFVDVNGVRQNTIATYYLKLPGVKSGSRTFTLTFEDKTGGTLTRKNFNVKDGWEYTFLIREKDPSRTQMNLTILGNRYSLSSLVILAENNRYEMRQVSGINLQGASADAFTPASDAETVGNAAGNAQPDYSYTGGATYSAGNPQTESPSAPAPGHVCNGAMDAGAFEPALQSLLQQSFDDARLNMARQIVNTNCFSSAQVRRMVSSFTYEANRVTLAKYAWHHTVDRENFFVVFDALEFEQSVNELSNYMNANR